jgi:L-rhamnose-H+ transport protein
MATYGILYALLSGICNGLFTTPMKLMRRWRWENIWLVFILTACLVMPFLVVAATAPDYRAVFERSPQTAVVCAVLFGFLWGFGAILFGLTVDRLGISLANSMVIGLSSALGSIVPILLSGTFRMNAQHSVLFLGILVFLAGVWLCGEAGRLREGGTEGAGQTWRFLLTGYVFAVGAGVLSAIFNIGYSLAQPIREAGERMGYSSFAATNCIWLLMLAAGSLPNIVFCGLLLRKNRAVGLYWTAEPGRSWALSVLMGLLWGGSIFLYGAATPLLGDIGPSVGWPLSLACALLVANSMGIVLGEWKAAPPAASGKMRRGVGLLMVAIFLCALSTRLNHG